MHTAEAKGKPVPRMRTQAHCRTRALQEHPKPLLLVWWTNEPTYQASLQACQLQACEEHPTVTCIHHAPAPCM